MQEKKYESILALLGEKPHGLIDSMDDVPYVALPSEKPEIICFAGKIKELSGYDANELLADREHWANMIHPDDQERVFAAFNKCRNEGTPFEIEYRIVHKDGSLRYVIDKGEPVFNSRGEITQIEGIITTVGQGSGPENILLSEIMQVTKLSNANSSVFEKV